jgi:hypothetical protein
MMSKQATKPGKQVADGPLPLNTIKILFRAPDTLALYGVPYEMRPGQQPGDLWRAGRKEGWIWLGSPGWWGHLSHENQAAIKAFLAKHSDIIPNNPYEWDRIEESTNHTREMTRPRTTEAHVKDRHDASPLSGPRKEERDNAINQAVELAQQTGAAHAVWMDKKGNFHVDMAFSAPWESTIAVAHGPQGHVSYKRYGVGEVHERGAAEAPSVVAGSTVSAEEAPRRAPSLRWSHDGVASGRKGTYRLGKTTYGWTVILNGRASIGEWATRDFAIEGAERYDANTASSRTTEAVSGHPDDAYRAQTVGAKHAEDQIQSDYFRDWVHDQLIEAEQMRKRDPSSVIPFDAKRVAKRMLQQLSWDTKHGLRSDEILEMVGSDDGDTRATIRAFFEGFDAKLREDDVVNWLADEVIGPMRPQPKKTAKRRPPPKTRRRRR